MELAGLKRAFEDILEKNVNLHTLVTDRHSGIKKYMREKHANKTHKFDVFHLAKCKNTSGSYI